MPFVGTQLNATTASENTLFGIIFGTDKSGYTQKQYYSSSQYKETNVYSTIEKVTVKGGQLFYGAFSNCQDIKTIIICDSVTKIGDNCFSGCGGLESITLPYIGRDLDTPSVFGYLFGKNSYWQGVSTTQNSVYYIPKYLHSVTITGGKIIGGAFYNCTSITDVRIESNVYYIGSQAFVGCSALKRIYLKKTYSTKPSRYTISGDSGRQPEYTANRLKSGDYSEYAYEISN